MKNTTNYTINFTTKEIIITKKFGKAASQIGSPEFMEMGKLRREFSDYKIVYKEIQKKENKKSYKGLTIDEMNRFMSGRANEEQELFKKVIDVAANRKGKYAIIKKWFLDNYKEAYEEEIKEIKIA